MFFKDSNILIKKSKHSFFKIHQLHSSHFGLVQFNKDLIFLNKNDKKCPNKIVI